MKKIVCLCCCLGLAVFTLNAQQISAPQNDPQKFALVIGNGAYTNEIGPLANPVNDANDMSDALRELGFTVDKVLDGSHDQMDRAVVRLKERLSASKDSYGFVYYAGHAVQSGGVNYLIPVGVSIPDESFLGGRTITLQQILGSLNLAKNGLNIVVLDACRNNPFGWARSVGGRGLAVEANQPADSIIAYATSAGSIAADSDGASRNGLYTVHLLNNIKTPGLEVKDMLNRTGADVQKASNRRQIPAIYNQFFGTAYLGKTPDEAKEIAQVQVQPLQPLPLQPQPQPSPQPQPKPPSEPRENRQDADKSGQLRTLGASIGTSISAPWLIGTVHGTIALFRHSFLEIGLDAGFISGAADVGYYSLYPFAHLGLYLPVGNGGLYAGAGGGYMIAEYRFPEAEEPLPLRMFAFDLNAGVRFNNGITISYTLRTDFSTVSNKFALGYLYRF